MRTTPPRLKFLRRFFGTGGQRLLWAKYYALIAGDLVAIDNKSEALKNYEKSLKILDEILEQGTDDKFAKALNEIRAEIKRGKANLAPKFRFQDS